MALREIKGVVDRVPWENVSPPPKIKEKKMTNREWLEIISVKELAQILSNCCNVCAYHDVTGCVHGCEDGILKWLGETHDRPKELTQAQLCEAFELKFGKRRAISLDEIREVTKEIFK